MGNIRDNMLQMKNMSELQLDLAYSALFLQDKAFAHRVKELQEEMRVLERETTKYIFRVKESDEDRTMMLELIGNMRDISNIAVNIAEMTKGPIPPIIRDVLTETKERVVTATVAHDSVFANKKLDDSEVRTHTKVLIIAIKRKEEWLFEINRDTELKAGDLLVGIGTGEAEKLFKDAVRGKIKRVL